jgi:hypothetical protein
MCNLTCPINRCGNFPEAFGPRNHISFHNFFCASWCKLVQVGASWCECKTVSAKDANGREMIEQEAAEERREIARIVRRMKNFMR